MSSALFFVVNSKARETRVHAKLSFCEGGDERRGGGGGEILLCSCASLALLSLTKMRSALSLGGGGGGGVQIITGSLINCLLRKTFRLEK